MVRYAFDTPVVIACLNKIIEAELAGVIRYTHYSLMIFGPNRIPIVDWLRQQANESLLHAQQVGELITQLGEHPSLAIGELLESHQHDTQTILKESLDHEEKALELYRELLTLVENKSVMFEEFARTMVYEEELHVGEVEKMLGGPAFVH